MWEKSAGCYGIDCTLPSNDRSLYPSFWGLDSETPLHVSMACYPPPPPYPTWPVLTVDCIHCSLVSSSLGSKFRRLQTVCPCGHLCVALSNFDPYSQTENLPWETQVIQSIKDPYNLMKSQQITTERKTQAVYRFNLKTWFVPNCP